MNEMRNIIEEHASNRILQKADMLLDSAMMNAERWDVFNEYKYICDMRQLTEIKYRIAPFMKLDSHTGENTGYVIRSMYFDDYDNTCYYDNLNGADPREKFRIRIYNGESVQKIQFERCNLMNFSDVLKKSFIRNFTTTDIGTMDVVVVMLVTLLISLYIFWLYRVITRKNFYNKNFNVSLTAIALITAAIIITIQSSIVVSLGMVGALSIVRFRTAVKDPLNLVFMFWAISVGIICGAGLYSVAIIASAVITVAIYALNLLPIVKPPAILVVECAAKDTENDITRVVSQYSNYYKVKSRSISQDKLNMVIEMRIKDGGGLLQEINSIENVEYVSILDHDGEVTF